MDWPKLHGEIPGMLLRAQTQLEEAVEAFGLAADLEAETRAIYKCEKGKLMLKYKKEGMAVGLIEKVVDGELSIIEMDYEKSKGRKEKCRHLIDAIRERSYNIRHLSRDGEKTIKGA